MSKQKKVHKIGEPRKARSRNHAEVSTAELHELGHPGQGAAATNGNDSVLAIAGRELKVTSQNVRSAVKKEVDQLRRDLGQLASAGSVLKNARSAREFASITIDVSSYGSEGAMDTLLVQQITEQVRSRIQEGLDQNLELRKSMFW